MNKTCKDCLIDLPLDDFRLKKNYYESTCKKCANHSPRLRKKVAPNYSLKIKNCTFCKNSLLINLFHKNSRNKDGFNNHCKTCIGIKKKNNFIPRKSHGSKQCYKCKTQKDVSEFYSDKQAFDGLSSSCKVCSNHSRRMRKYNLTSEQYFLIINTTKSCEICLVTFTDDTQTHIDHCHKTGTMRGLICSNCNYLLGFAKDNISTLENAIKYLKENL